ncbi:NAD(P)H-dependent oxidoreductase subunit E [candidate division TA06 bacterium]|uniref:NAD(P)H-dependent oxidoreductase subunit E n=1 Tax=candidate division TA06 bacterium TaxID=2250710 RepID=A0A523UUE2_UNCT6|nr:MAG: NAD(P)H-dependent oxidoreductase subunit E [candidate division TA06 bacterium]
MISNPGKISSIIESFGAAGGSLISMLQEIQAEYHYLPRDALVLIAERTGLPLSQVFSTATFYNAFSLTPRGKHLISVCLGTACHVRGGPKITDKIGRELNVEAGATTDDLQFTLETVRCVGCCALAPVVRIDEDTHGHVTQKKVPAILKKYARGDKQDEDTKPQES